MREKVVTVALNPSIDKTVTVKEFVPYGLNRVEHSQVDPGGKGINVARVLHSFGVKSTAAGFLAGHTGKLLQNFLAQDGIDSDFMEIPGETRINIKIFDRKAKKITEVNESGCVVSSEELPKFQERFRELCGEARITIMTGSLPPGVPDNVYAQFIETAKAAGAQTILDADGEALKKGIASRPFAIKPNIHELEALAGRPLATQQDVLAFGRELIHEGIGLVIVSMGADGAIVLNEKEAYKTDPWKIQVKSATGSGDSMVAALAAELMRGASLSDIARAATAAGTVTASKPGTQLCTEDEVRKALPLVTLHPLEL